MPLIGVRPALQPVVRAVLSGDAQAHDTVWRNGRLLTEIVRAAQNGDREASNALCTVLRLPLERIASCMGVAHRDIPDLVQDTLVAAHLNLARFDPARGSMQTWVTTILARLRLNLLRHRARRLKHLEDLVGGVNRSAARHRAVPATRPIGIDIVDLLGLLSRRQRQVITIYAIIGLSARETGQIIGMTAAGVRSIARDARRRLSRNRDRS